MNIGEFYHWMQVLHKENDGEAVQLYAHQAFLNGNITLSDYYKITDKCNKSIKSKLSPSNSRMKDSK